MESLLRIDANASDRCVGPQGDGRARKGEEQANEKKNQPINTFWIWAQSIGKWCMTRISNYCWLVVGPMARQMVGVFVRVYWVRRAMWRNPAKCQLAFHSQSRTHSLSPCLSLSREKIVCYTLKKFFQHFSCMLDEPEFEVCIDLVFNSNGKRTRWWTKPIPIRPDWEPFSKFSWISRVAPHIHAHICGHMLSIIHIPSIILVC